MTGVKNNQLIQPPVGILSTKLKSWDKPVIDKICSILLAFQRDEHNKARLLAASAAHDSDWLQALLISSCGLRIDDEAVRVAVGLRLYTNLCDQHRCPCGTVVDCRGTHGLSCNRSSARIARHSYINDIIHRALVRAKIASVKEPVGLSLTDEKLPDGLTLIPWQIGKNPANTRSFYSISVCYFIITNNFIVFQT